MPIKKKYEVIWSKKLCYDAAPVAAADAADDHVSFNFGVIRLERRN
jgi:hypothetical protein